MANTPVFRFYPRWPGMEKDLRDAGVDQASLPTLIEMLERRDIDLENWLEHYVGQGGTGPVGIVRGDLYDDFTSAPAGTPPPVAETGQSWTQVGGTFTTVYQQGLFTTTPTGTVMYGLLLADSLKANGRLRGRIHTAPSGHVSCGMVFRADGLGQDSALQIKFENYGSGGVTTPTITLCQGRFGPLQTATGVSLGGNTVYDLDVVYSGTQITATINGVAAINYNTATGLEANTKVGFRANNSNYGAFGDGGDFMTYIWCSDS